MRAFLLIAALALAISADAAPNRLRVYPNSLTIFSMAQGPDGMLWLAAEDGLYRFDGFHYHKITGYPFASARFVAFTRDGTLWVADFQGIPRFPNNPFTVILPADAPRFAPFGDSPYAP